MANGKPAVDYNGPNQAGCGTCVHVECTNGEVTCCDGTKAAAYSYCPTDVN